MDTHLKALTESLTEDCYPTEKKQTVHTEAVFYRTVSSFRLKNRCTAEVAGQCQGEELKIWMDVFL